MDTKAPHESQPTEAVILRQQAEERLLASGGGLERLLGEGDIRALVHELQVHQIELEMQQEELQQARLAAEQSANKYSDLFDFAPVGYFLLDRKGMILEVNVAGAGLLGHHRDRLSRNRFAQFVATGDQQEFDDFFKRVFDSDSKQTCELKIFGNKTSLNAIVEGIATQDAQGQSELCRMAVIDITLPKRAAELAAANEALKIEVAARDRVARELRAAKDSAESAQEVAEDANRAKDYFLAALSHELRMPLTPVVMALAMLQERVDVDPFVRETLEMIRRNVDMEARLIDDLLDVARIVRGGILLRREPVALYKVLQRAVEVCMPDIEARDLTLSMEIGPDVPWWVEADVARLQQIFWNVLKNAVKFSTQGGAVGIRCREEESCVLVAVTDNGIGIEREALTRIFKAFEQADRSMARRFGGLGMGLAISKALVELHGGTIWAESKGEGKGATFYVRLPLCEPPCPTEAPEPAAAPEQALRSLRILLVEDHAVTARMMQLVLTREGHTVEAAGDVATGLEMADRQAYDLLVSDLGLPDGSGHELIRELRARGHTFPAIALSGYGQEEDVQRSREAGFASHLTKPASREAVVAAVAALTGGRA